MVSTSSIGSIMRPSEFVSSFLGNGTSRSTKRRSAEAVDRRQENGAPESAHQESDAPSGA